MLNFIKKPKKISVSILKEKDNYKSVIEKLNDEKIDYIHIDVMDNTFTSNSSFCDDEFINSVNSSKKLDVHIMSTNLDKLICKYIKLKPKYISFHYEATRNIDKYIKIIKDNNIKVGLAISPDTKISEVEPYFDKIDMLLILSVKPGFGGQKFDKKVIEKLKQIKKNKFKISIDGGINNETYKLIKKYVDI